MDEAMTIDVVQNNCYRILENIYGNIIEFNCEEQTLCFRKLSDSFSSPFLLSVKMSSDNTVNYFVETFISEKDADKIQKLLESINKKTELYEPVDFDYKALNGELIPCRGRIFCNGYSCWLCFDENNPSEKKVTAPKKSGVVIHTLGYFDVFVNDSAVLFRSKKAKELLKFIVEHAGGYVTSHDAAKHLWPDEPVDQKILSRCRKVAMLLHQTLEEYGIEEIVENRCGKRRIVKEKVECDLFNH